MSIEPDSSGQKPTEEYQKDSAAYQQLWTEFLRPQIEGLPLEQMQQISESFELAVHFLLTATDNGGEYFASAVHSTLTYARVEVAQKVESGNIAQAQKLAKLTQALGAREHNLYTHQDNGKGGVRSVRQTSPPIDISRFDTN